MPVASVRHVKGLLQQAAHGLHGLRKPPSCAQPRARSGLEGRRSPGAKPWRCCPCCGRPGTGSIRRRRRPPRSCPLGKPGSAGRDRPQGCTSRLHTPHSGRSANSLARSPRDLGKAKRSKPAEHHVLESLHILQYQDGITRTSLGRWAKRGFMHPGRSS